MGRLLIDQDGWKRWYGTHMHPSFGIGLDVKVTVRLRSGAVIINNFVGELTWLHHPNIPRPDDILWYKTIDE